MALTGNKLIHIRSAIASAVPTSAQMVAGQIAMNTLDQILFIKNSGGTVVPIASTAALTLATSSVQRVNNIGPVSGNVTIGAADIGAHGVPPLDINGKILTSNLPDAILGAVRYQGTWDASTNTPTLPDPVTVKGFYYIVSTGGTQFGLTFSQNDWVISDGTQWDKVDAMEGVISVNAKQGAVVLNATDVGALPISGGEITANLIVDGNLNVGGVGTFSNPIVIPAATTAGQGANLGQVQSLISTTAPVRSVNTKTGVVVLTSSDIGAVALTGAATQTIAGAVIVSGALTGASLTTGGALDVTGNAHLRSTVTVDGVATFIQPVTVHDAVAPTDATSLQQVQGLIAAIPVSGGTVTSVNVSVPSILASTGGPVTTTGTIALSLNTQAATLVFAGPGTGADAIPTFRALIASDIPSLDEGTFA